MTTKKRKAPRRKKAPPAPVEKESSVVSDRNVAGEMKKGVFAETFGVSESQLERLFQQGMPHQKTSAREVVVPMPAGRVWYHDYLISKGKKQAAPKDIDEARRRKAAAEAELAELELARERAVTMKVEDHERLLGEAFGRVRAKLLNLAPRAAGAVFGAPSLQECQAKIEPVVQEIMEELARADDVPESDVVDDEIDADDDDEEEE